ncbi:hypothetical protein AA18895_1774 [Acetobacter ghanensis DSM 18895]|nr:hypothetical protein AA18895_1774 [Acetobacter ghanensis DSM 18895]
MVQNVSRLGYGGKGGRHQHCGGQQENRRHKATKQHKNPIQAEAAAPGCRGSRPTPASIAERNDMNGWLFSTALMPNRQTIRAIFCSTPCL